MRLHTLVVSPSASGKGYGKKLVKFYEDYVLSHGCPELRMDTRACLKNHSRNLHASLCGIFCPNSVVVARYDALIRAKSPTNCDAHLAESLFQTRSRFQESFSLCPHKQQLSCLSHFSLLYAQLQKLINRSILYPLLRRHGNKACNC